MLVNTTINSRLVKSASSEARSAARGVERAYFYLFLLFIFILPLWPNYVEMKFSGLPNLAPDRLLRILLSLGFIWIFFTNSESVKLLKERLRQNKFLTWIIILYFLIRCSSSILSADSITQLKNYIFRTDLVIALPVYFFALLAVNNKNNLNRILIAIVISGVISSIVSVIEFQQASNVFAQFISVNNDYQMSILLDKSRDNIYRAQGTFEHMNYGSGEVPESTWRPTDLYKPNDARSHFERGF